MNEVIELLWSQVGSVRKLEEGTGDGAARKLVLAGGANWANVGIVFGDDDIGTCLALVGFRRFYMDVQVFGVDGNIGKAQSGCCRVAVHKTGCDFAHASETEV